MIKIVKNKSFILLIVFFLFSNFVIAQKKITILHTNNINGALENCLCEGHPYGSLEKIKVEVDKIRRETKNLLLLDGGDMLSPFGNVVKDSFAVAIIKMLGYDAITIGDQEFSNGVGFLENNVKKSGLPLISANVSINGTNPFQVYVIKNIGSVNIGIIGVLAPKAFSFFPADKIKGVQAQDYKTTITSSIEKVRGKVDLIVLLSHLGYETDEEVAKTFSDINVIVGGHTQSALEKPVKIGNAIIVQAGNDGYYLGRLDIELDAQNKIQNYNGKLITMDISLPNDAEVLKFVKAYNFREVQKSVARGGYIQSIPAKYVIAENSECAKCHALEHSEWEETLHAKSIDSIVKKGRAKELKCVSCHVSGFGRIDGFFNKNITKGLGSVNCTECHYTYSEHLKNPSKVSVEKVTESLCVRCHDSANDPDFNFAKLVNLVNHPKSVAMKEKDKIAVKSVSKTKQIENITNFSEGKVHIVENGETLSLIAKRIYGDYGKWKVIYEANKSKINNPNLIYPKQELTIPLP
jgi:LysM repeat protein